MQSLQDDDDDESPWVEDNGASSHHAEAEWTSLSTSFTTAGYRDGISAGKEAALQEGFDAGFARTGAPRGRELGVLRGLAAALLLHLTRSPGPSAELAQARVQGVVDELAGVRFADLVPPTDEESTALREADALCGASGSGSAKADESEGQSVSPSVAAADLRTLRTRLEALLLEAGLNVPFGPR